MTWTPSTNNPFGTGSTKGIAWNGSVWIAVGGDANGVPVIATSSDGMTWTSISNNPFSDGGENSINGVAAQVVLPYTV
jgi:hypothetical protein